LKNTKLILHRVTIYYRKRF